MLTLGSGKHGSAKVLDLVTGSIYKTTQLPPSRACQL